MKIKKVYHSIIFSVGEIRERLHVTPKKKISIGRIYNTMAKYYRLQRLLERNRILILFTV